MGSKRMSRDAVNIRIASLISQRATCERLSVGAVFTLDNRIISTGYNGPTRGEPHCNPFDCKVDQPCRRSVHAEINAIYNLPKPPDDFHNTLVLYLTHAPCLGCSVQLETMVKEVYFLNLFRDNSGIKNLINKGIPVKKINLNGVEIPYEI